MTLPKIQAMELRLVDAVADDPDWIYEIKYDGFRALAYIEEGRCQLVSRTGHHYTRFRKLARRIPDAVDATTAILDGEVVCLDSNGQSQFYDLMFNKAEPIFSAFDLLYLNGDDLRDEPLFGRKRQLETVLTSQAILYVQHVDTHGTALFKQMCDRDMEGIVAKPKISPYREVRGKTSWLKIKNPDYSQAEGRGDLFNQ